MRWSDPKQAGVDFTLFQCMDALVGMAGGVIAGYAAQHFGYGIFFAAGKDDSLETAYLNKNFLRNCLRIADYDFLLPGGEGVYDFDVVPDSDGVLWISPNLRLPGADSPPPEQVLDRVEEIGFAHETVTADRQEGEATPFYVHELLLPEPLPLSTLCRILVE